MNWRTANSSDRPERVSGEQPAASSQLVSNLNHAAEMIELFKQVATDRNYSNRRIFDLGDLTEKVIRSLRPGLEERSLTLDVDCRQV